MTVMGHHALINFYKLEDQSPERPLSKSYNPVLPLTPPPEDDDHVALAKSVMKIAKRSCPKIKEEDQPTSPPKRVSLAATHPSCYQPASSSQGPSKAMLPPPRPAPPRQISHKAMCKPQSSSKAPWLRYSDPMHQVCFRIPDWDVCSPVTRRSDLDVTHGNVTSPVNIVMLPFGAMVESSDSEYIVRK